MYMYTFSSLALHSESTGASPVNVCDLTSIERGERVGGERYRNIK